MQEDLDIIQVKFDRTIEIMQFGITELSDVVAAKYNKSMLIPKRNSPRKIELGDKAFILRPKPYFKTVATYHKKFQRVNVYAVDILQNTEVLTEVLVEAETGKKIGIFENVFIPKNLLRDSCNSNIAQILIKKPDGKHSNYLVLIKIEDANIRELFQVFFEKNNYMIKLLNQEKDNNGDSDNLLLEIIVDGGMEIKKVKELVMVPFHIYFSLPKSEA